MHKNWRPILAQTPNAPCYKTIIRIYLYFFVEQMIYLFQNLPVFLTSNKSVIYKAVLIAKNHKLNLLIRHVTKCLIFFLTKLKSKLKHISIKFQIKKRKITFDKYPQIIPIKKIKAPQMAYLRHLWGSVYYSNSPQRNLLSL